MASILLWDPFPDVLFQFPVQPSLWNRIRRVVIREGIEGDGFMIPQRCVDRGIGEVVLHGGGDIPQQISWPLLRVLPEVMGRNISRQEDVVEFLENDNPLKTLKKLKTALGSVSYKFSKAKKNSKSGGIFFAQFWLYGFYKMSGMLLLQLEAGISGKKQKYSRNWWTTSQVENIWNRRIALKSEESINYQREHQQHQLFMMIAKPKEIHRKRSKN